MKVTETLGPASRVWAILMIAVAGIVLVWGLSAAENALFAIAGATGTIVLLAPAGNLRRMTVVFLISLSVVVPILVLPWSVLTYFRLDDAMFGMLCLWWLKDRNGRHPGTVSRLVRDRMLFPFLLFNGVVLLSMLLVVMTAGTQTMMLGNLAWYALRHFQAMAVFLMAYSLRTDRGFLLLAGRLIVYASSILTVVGILQYVNLIPWYDYLGFATMFHLGRENGIVSLLGFNHAHYGAYVTVATLIGLELMDEDRPRWQWFALVPLNLFGLILSLSRASWAAFLVGLLFLQRPGRRLVLVARAALVSIAAAIVMVQGGFGEDVGARLGYGGTDEAASAMDSATWRIDNNRLAVDFVSSRPEVLIVGVGYMNWRYEVNRFAEGRSSGGHNNFLTVLLELGVVGMVAFLWFWGGLSFRIGRLHGRDSPGARAVRAGIVGLVVSCASQETLYPVWSMESLLTFVALIGGLWLGAGSEEGSVNPPPD